MKNGTKRTSDLSILYVESDLSLQKEITLHLKKIFSKVFQAFDGITGLSEYKKIKPDIVLTDLNLSNKNAFEMIVDMQDLDSKVSIIVLSNKNDDFELLETLDLGIIALLQKPLHLTNLNRALQKVILLKPNKITPPKVVPPKPKEVKRKVIRPEPIKRKPITPLSLKKLPEIKPVKKEPIPVKPIKIQPIKEEPAKIKPSKPQPLKVVPIIDYTQCNEIIASALEDKLNVTCVNNYKGLIISNNAEIITFDNKLFTLQVTKTQLFSIVHEKQIILAIRNQYILAKLFRVDKKNNQITLKNAQFIQYKPRDNTNKRITVDKSFKATIGYDNTHKELTPSDVSYDFIALESTEELDIKEDTAIELTMGFEIDAPSSLVNEKKFTKVFATGVVKRIHKLGNKQKVIIEHKIQKSGQNVYKKYLQQREINIINEFKMKMKS